MPWNDLLLPLRIGLSVLALLVVISAVRQVVLWTVGRPGYAPGWRLRCGTCGRTKDASEAGLVRIGVRSRGKSVLGYCRGCRALRWVRVERDPAVGRG